MREANGIRDAAAFPLQPDNSADAQRFEVGSMRRLPLQVWIPLEFKFLQESEVCDGDA